MKRRRTAGLPDWRDRGQYPPATAGLATWAWEALRRDSTYQADYASAHEEALAKPLSKSSADLAHELAQKYGMEELQDPRDPQPPRWRHSDPRIALEADLDTIRSGPEATAVAFIRFELARPLADQRAASKRVLKTLQAEWAAAHPDARPDARVRRNGAEYARLLRVVDAFNAGASKDEIIAELQLGSEYDPDADPRAPVRRLSYLLARAVALIGGEWRLLVAKAKPARAPRKARAKPSARGQSPKVKAFLSPSSL